MGILDDYIQCIKELELVRIIIDKQTNVRYYINKERFNKVM